MIRRRTFLYETRAEEEDTYLRFKALSNCQVKFTGTTVNKVLNTLQYSTNNGGTWSALSNNTYVSLNKGKSILFKGNCISNTSSTGIGTFASTDGTFEVRGNIMSLLFSDNYENQTDLTGYGNVFYRLFSGCTGVANIDNLVLPATTLVSGCYYQMFRDCTSLTSIPSGLLPATNLTGCDWCYAQMFYGCTRLTSIPNGLLPSTTLATSCYQNLFQGCSKLETVPSNLLPATTLATNCYGAMFYSCPLLTTAPDLPARKLVNGCYSNMFNGCKKLNYIKAMFTTTPTNYASYWVYGVAATGTFVKNSAATWNVSGPNGIPSGWTIQTASS